MPWCNNENKIPTIYNFHIHFNDFKNNIFDKVIPSCIIYKKRTQMIVLLNILFLLQLKEHKEIKIPV